MANVILSGAKNLTEIREILRFAQNDGVAKNDYCVHIQERQIAKPKKKAAIPS